jgi:hypothetical protein
MILQRWDLGEIIRNHTYIREIYSCNFEEKCLFSSEGLLHKLCRIYDYLGIQWSDSKEINVKVKFPDNSNPLFKDYWHRTTIRKSTESSSILMIDRLSGFFRKEVVFASSAWMGEFESFQGDEVVISPCVPVLQINKR